MSAWAWLLPGLVLAGCGRDDVRSPVDAGPSHSASGSGSASSAVPASSVPRAAEAASAAPGDGPVYIPGVLVVSQTGNHAPSHGVLYEPWRAIFRIENLTPAPLSVRVSELTFGTDDAKCPPASRRQRVRLESAEVDGVSAGTASDGVLAFMAPPRRVIELVLRGAMDDSTLVYYHVHYWHAATFSVSGVEVRARGDRMYFRRPVPRPR